MDEQQIKEKYYQFMEIDILEFIKNWEDFISPYICEKSFFKQMDDYIKKLSLEEQKQYKEKEILLKSTKITMHRLYISIYKEIRKILVLFVI